MIEGLSVLVPFHPDGGSRDAIWRHVHDRLLYALPGAEIVVSDDRRENPDLFNRPQALNMAARLATGDLFLIADADTTYGAPYELVEAIQEARKTSRWALPAYYRKIDRPTSERILSLHAGEELDGMDFEWVGERQSWSGLVLVPAVAYWSVRGSDERYAGWGADDIALGLALETLYGPHRRWPGSALHFWHPSGAQENGLHEHGDAGRDLTGRYIHAANGHPDLMRALIAEKP